MSEVLNDLAKARAVFQQRTVTVILGQQPIATTPNAVVKGELKHEK